MKKVEQTSLFDGEKDRPGDCLRAAWASVLEVEAEDLPRWDGNLDWLTYWRNFQVFFRMKGYEICRCSYGKPLQWKTPFDTFTAVGPSPRTDLAKHVVVYDWKNGFRWDPYPGANGLDGDPDYYEWLRPTEVEFDQIENYNLGEGCGHWHKNPPFKIR